MFLAKSITKDCVLSISKQMNFQKCAYACFLTHENTISHLYASMHIFIFIHLQNPEPGQWKLQKNGTDSWTVNVTAQSALDFSASILEKSAEGNSYQLTGNPIIGASFICFFIPHVIFLNILHFINVIFSLGNQYSVVVDIPNLTSPSTCSKVALLCSSGTDVFEFNVTRVRFNGFTRYTGDFIPSNKVKKEG